MDALTEQNYLTDKCIVSKKELIAIADMIRYISGDTNKFTLSEMPNKIAEIQDAKSTPGSIRFINPDPEHQTVKALLMPSTFTNTSITFPMSVYISISTDLGYEPGACSKESPFLWDGGTEVIYIDPPIRSRKIDFSSFASFSIAEYKYIKKISSDLWSTIDNSIAKGISMDHMMSGCEGLLEFTMPSINMDTIISANSMFENDRSLTSINMIKFDPSNLKSLDKAFYGCTNIQTINAPNFTGRSVQSMKQLFQGCSNLKNILLSNFTGNSLQNIDTNSFEKKYYSISKATYDIPTEETSLRLKNALQIPIHSARTVDLRSFKYKNNNILLYSFGKPRWVIFKNANVDNPSVLDSSTNLLRIRIGSDFFDNTHSGLSPIYISLDGWILKEGKKVVSNPKNPGSSIDPEQFDLSKASNIADSNPLVQEIIQKCIRIYAPDYMVEAFKTHPSLLKNCIVSEYSNQYVMDLTPCVVPASTYI